MKNKSFSVYRNLCRIFLSKSRVVVHSELTVSRRICYISCIGHNRKARCVRAKLRFNAVFLKRVELKDLALFQGSRMAFRFDPQPMPHYKGGRVLEEFKQILNANLTINCIRFCQRPAEKTARFFFRTDKSLGSAAVFG